jgi:hypothetical protein
MSVRAKFKVTSITRSESSRRNQETGQYDPCELHSIEMSPVFGNGDPNHENTKFWEASPSGHLKLGCVNEEAAKQFELGKEYYIDFTPAG